MRLIEVPAAENLAPFSQFLWQHRVVHRIFEERGLQVLEIADAAQAEEVQRAFDAWRAGKLEIRVVPRAVGDQPSLASRAARLLQTCPGVLLVLVLALLAFPFSVALGEGQISEIALALTIVDLRSVSSASLSQLLADMQIWRWLTPIFLHFSLVHLVFNSVITFDLGRRIEAQKGTTHFLLLVMATGVASNFGQVLLNTNPFFGGLSGVAYGLLGYLVVMQRRFPGNGAWHLPPGLAIGLVVFLVFFSTGITESFGLHVANAAHWSGLITGALIALISSEGAGAGAVSDVER
jgi:GlpG protein